jgi:hypothetical protein
VNLEKVIVGCQSIVFIDSSLHSTISNKMLGTSYDFNSENDHLKRRHSEREKIAKSKLEMVTNLAYRPSTYG